MRSSCLAFALLLAAFPVSAQVGFDVVHATGGVHRADGFVPFHVRLQNATSEDLELRLEGSWDAVPVRVVRDVDLAAGTRKELSFYLGPAAYANDFEIRLRRADGELLGENLLTSVAVSPERSVVGVFGRHPLGWGTLKEAGLFEGMVAQLDAATLPDFAAALDTFSMLVWTRPQPRRLRPEQIRAVRRWIAAGGRLVLTAAEVPPGEAVAPWTAVRTTELMAVHELPSLAELAGGFSSSWRQPLAVARLRTDFGEAVLQEDWGAVAVFERLGLGSVIVLGFDPGDPRLIGWPGLGALWLRLSTVGEVRIPDPPDHPSRGGGYFDLRGMALTLLSQDPGGSPPSTRALLWVLVLYLLAIGPGEYFLLKRWRRLSWTWFTFPVWVLLFSFGAYAAAVSSRTDAATIRHVLIRDLWPGVAAEELHASLYLPRSGRCLMRPRWPRGLALTGESMYEDDTLRYYSRSGRSLSERELESLVPVAAQGDTAVRARRPRWSYLTASFLRETVAPGVTVEAELDWRGEKLVGRLTPRLGVDLADAWVVAPRGRVPTRYNLGPLADGRTLDFDGVPGLPLELSEPWTWSYGDPPRQVAEVLTQLTAWRLLLAGAPPPHPEARHLHRRNQVGPADGQRDWSSVLASGGAVFLAWAEDSESRLDTGDLEAASDGIVIYRIPWTSPATLPVAVGPGGAS